MPDQVRVPMCACPNCQHPLDAVTAVNDVHATPQEGDISICINCATPLVFDADSRVQAMSEELRNSLPMSNQVQLTHAIAAVMSMQLFDRLRKAT